MWGSGDFGVKKWGRLPFNHALVILLSLFCLSTGKVYNTEDSVVLEGDPPPRLPGPSIFDYKNEAIFPLASQIQASSPEGENDSTKVKRERGAKPKDPDKSLPNHPRYYEIAGDQMYVFEPSSLGAEPFMDTLQSQSRDIDAPHHPQTGVIHREHHHHHFALPGPLPHPPHHPHVVVKVSSNPFPHDIDQNLGPFNFDSVKIERVTPRDAVLTSSGRGRGQARGQNQGQLGPGPIDHSSSSPGDFDWEDPEYSESEGDKSDEDRNESSPTGDGECVSANEKDGQCVPFRRCYPVVFNSVTGELRNHGLARMLYQASGPCGKANDSWTVPTVSVQLQSGVSSNVPLEIPPDFSNHTVCCPGYFYFEENTIPHHFPPRKGHKPRQNHDHDLQDNKESKPPLKLKLKPSHPDPMLSPQLQEGRSFPFQHQNRHPHQRRHRGPIIMAAPPPRILLHPHEMFDSDPETEMDYNNGNGYHFEESEDDFDSSYYTTARPRTTEGPLSKPRQRYRQKVNETVEQSQDSRNVTNPGNPGNDKGTEADGSSRSEVKVGAGSSPEKNGAVKKVSSTDRGNSTKSGTGTNSTVKSGPKKRKPVTATGNKLGSNRTQNHAKSKVPKSEAAVPVVVPPPHLSAWNCPGRQMGMPRGQWPWMVALLNEGSHFCSGALIDHRSVLTSASCVTSFQGKDIGRMRAILGDRVLYSSVDGPHIWRKIVRITRHLLYSPESMENDIAILEMETSVTFTPNIQPINLPSTSNKGHTDKAIVSGWSGADLGKRWFSARPIVDAVVEFMDIEKCQRRYNGFKGEIPEGVICTKPNITTCKADLGAPLIIKTGNCWHIIGILSHGLGCGSFPDVYLDTSKYLSWIQKNIRPHFLIEETFLKT